jgi:chemotaxis protein methyltransferase CheR
MRNQNCVAFLQWCLPRLGLRWAGFRKVRGTVCKRVARRIRALGFADVAAYRAFLEANSSEWPRLDAMCRIPISRFWRDRDVFDSLARDIFPALAAAALERGDTRVRVWSAGCASGEEAYSLLLAWSLHAEAAFPSVGVRIVATDVDETMLTRAEAGLYRRGSFRDMPPELVDRAFRLAFLLQDIRSEMPEGPFDLVLCRNLVFTYFDKPTQLDLLPKICAPLRAGAGFVIGSDETLPELLFGLVPWNGPAPIYRLSPPS